MGMTIDTAINVLGMVEAHGVCIEAKDIAVETMRKYQQLEKQIKQLQNRCHVLTHGQLCVFCSYECEHKTESEG